MTESALTQKDNYLPADLIRNSIQARSLSKSTWRVMMSQWKKFDQWGGKLPATADQVCDYLTHLADSGIKSSGLDSAKWAIDKVHKLKGAEMPSVNEKVRTHLKGLRRILVDERPDQARTEQKQPITINDIRKLNFSDDPVGRRDRALLLVGFASGLRRSELTAIRKEDVEKTDFGFRITIWKSKTNQEGLSESVDVIKATKGVNHKWCPVKALANLLDAVEGEYVFQSVTGKRQSARYSGKALSGISVGLIVKGYAYQLGLDPQSFGGHSLRAGCATYLLDQEIQPAAVQKQMRHKRFDTTQRYNRGETARALVGAY